MPECANCTLGGYTFVHGYGIIRVCTQIYVYCAHTHRYIFRYMYIVTQNCTCSVAHIRIRVCTNVYTWTRVAECGDREMVVGVGESRPAVEVDNFESSFNLSHPPERVSSLPSFPARPRVSILRPREPLFLHSNRFRSRCDSILEFCHVRASCVKRREHRWDGKKQVYLKSGRLKTYISL